MAHVMRRCGENRRSLNVGQPPRPGQPSRASGARRSARGPFVGCARPQRGRHLPPVDMPAAARSAAADYSHSFSQSFRPAYVGEPLPQVPLVDVLGREDNSHLRAPGYDLRYLALDS